VTEKEVKSFIVIIAKIYYSNLHINVHLSNIGIHVHLKHKYLKYVSVLSLCSNINYHIKYVLSFLMLNYLEYYLFNLKVVAARVSKECFQFFVQYIYYTSSHYFYHLSKIKQNNFDKYKSC